MQEKNVIYFNVLMLCDGRKEEGMNTNADKKRLSQARTLQQLLEAGVGNCFVPHSDFNAKHSIK